MAITPDGVRELTHAGVEVMVQSGAGEGASIADAAFRDAGARIVGEAGEVWERADIVCKVKEPQPSDGCFRDDLVLFTYLHLAAYPEVAAGCSTTE